MPIHRTRNIPTTAIVRHHEHVVDQARQRGYALDGNDVDALIDAVRNDDTTMFDRLRAAARRGETIAAAVVLVAILPGVAAQESLTRRRAGVRFGDLVDETLTNAWMILTESQAGHAGALALTPTRLLNRAHGRSRTDRRRLMLGTDDITIAPIDDHFEVPAIDTDPVAAVIRREQVEQIGDSIRQAIDDQVITRQQWANLIDVRVHGRPYSTFRGKARASFRSEISRTADRLRTHITTAA